MKTVAVAVAFVVLVVVAAASAPAAAMEAGLVRIYNRTDIPVTVYVLDVDFFGKRSWRPVREVAPGSSAYLENVPAGTTVGAQAPSARRRWQPRRVEYLAGRPIFDYVISR